MKLALVAPSGGASLLNNIGLLLPSLSRNRIGECTTHGRRFFVKRIKKRFSRNNRVFTHRPIHRTPDCEIEGRRGISLAMALRSPINLPDEDKLDVLQRLDRFRVWHSLDEKRYCLVCGKIITGREVHVTGGENGPLRVSCPTEHCNAIPMNWVRPTDEVLIKIAKLEAASRDSCGGARSPSRS